MFRVASFALPVAGLICLAAFSTGGPKFPERPLPANSTVANFFYQNSRPAPAPELSPETDSVKELHVLMLNYSAYDSAYAAKLRNLIARHLPGVILTEFWTGSHQSLRELLDDQQIVVVPYPANGKADLIRKYGEVLAQFVQKGGAVVFSGTDQFSVLQQYGLFDLEFGYFCTGLDVHEDVANHPVFEGTPSDFSLTNYVYPLDISDPNFVVLADVRGFPAVGYKSIGTGKVVYLGLEYYYDEPVSSGILENTLRWLAPERNASPNLAAERPNNWTARTVRRSEETLYAGNGKTTAQTPDFDLKIYPNPYFEKATLDINLEKAGPVSVEMTDETGVTVAVVLPYRMLNSGFYRLELPNVPAGVYFVKFQLSNQTSVRKVVKAAAQ